MSRVCKKADRPLWRDGAGKIVCRGGDRACEDCEPNCPIWLNTLGLQYAQADQHDEAIEAYIKATLAAPDFSDAWNNLGASCGLTGRYEMAREAYGKAYALAQKPGTLMGLALATRDCGDTDGAIRLCEEYRAKYADGRLDEAYRRLKEKQAPAPDLTYAILRILLKLGRKMDFFLSDEDSYPNIPEVAAMAQDTLDAMLDPLIAESRIDPPFDPIKLTLIWMALAGVGAVYLWNEDWPSLRQYGAYALLTQQRGLNRMDEYVCDLIGKDWGGGGSRELFDRIRFFCTLCMNLMEEKKTGDDPKNGLACQCYKAMFLTGMVMEMEELGMR